MTVAKPPILVFPLVAKHYTDTCARPDGNATKVSGNRHIKALLLGFNDSFEVEICVAFSVEIYINGVDITALRLRSVWRYQELHTQPGALVSWGITGKFQADRIMLERKTGLSFVSASIWKSGWCEV